MVKHYKLHFIERSYECRQCELFLLLYNYDLISHKEIYITVESNQCSLCNKAVVHASQFKLYILKHKGVKQFGCTKFG